MFSISSFYLYLDKFIKNVEKSKFRSVRARVQAEYEIHFNGNYPSNHSSFMNRLVYAFITIIHLTMHVNVGMISPFLFSCITRFCKCLSGFGSGGGDEFWNAHLDMSMDNHDNMNRKSTIHMHLEI